MEQRIVIVDDHAVVRAGIVEVIRRRPDLKVVAEAANAAEALRLIDLHKPNLAIIDVSLEVGMNGIELVKALRCLYEQLPLLVLSMHDEDLYGERALLAGATGYVMKRAPIERLYEGIDRVLLGRTYASADLLERLVRRGPTLIGSGTPTNTFERLSDRELEILELIGRGLGTREIAETLHLSVKTVETHRANLKAKLSIDTAPQLVRFAVQWLETR